MPTHDASHRDEPMAAYHEAAHALLDHRHRYPLRRGVTIDPQVAHCWGEANRQQEINALPPDDPKRRAGELEQAWDPDAQRRARRPCVHGLCDPRTAGCLSKEMPSNDGLGLCDIEPFATLSDTPVERERETRRRIGAMLAGELAVRRRFGQYRGAEIQLDILGALSAASVYIPGEYCDLATLARRIALLIDVALETDRQLREPANEQLLHAIAAALQARATLSRGDCAAIMSAADGPDTIVVPSHHRNPEVTVGESDGC